LYGQIEHRESKCLLCNGSVVELTKYEKLQVSCMPEAVAEVNIPALTVNCVYRCRRQK